MAWWKKERGVVDLTYLNKRGLLKTPQDDVKDFTSSSNPANDGGNAFGFLAGMASSAEPSPALSSSASSVSDSGMKNKIEDFEYKLDTLSRRINSVLDRLDLVEKKVERDLRNGSLD